MNLEWDDKKNAINQRQHGIAFDQIRLFDWSSARMYTDDRKDYGENRMIARGYLGDRLHVVVFVLRGERTRLISFRKANQREQRAYESETGA